jgi:hypothetical protein
MDTALFEPTISAGERPQPYAVDRAVTRTGISNTYKLLFHLTNTHTISVPETDWFGFTYLVHGAESFLRS